MQLEENADLGIEFSNVTKVWQQNEQAEDTSADAGNKNDLEDLD